MEGRGVRAPPLHAPMRILFISNYFPGDLGPLARMLAASPDNDVLCASNRQRKDYALTGVRRVRLKTSPLFGDAPPSLPGLWEVAVKRGSWGMRTFTSLRESWGTPDIIFATIAAGAAFFAPQAFPGAFLVTYTETGFKPFPHFPEEMRKAWTLVQSTLFLQANLSYAQGERQRALFPRGLRAHMRLVTPCVDTEVFSPAAAGPWTEGESQGPLLTLYAAGLDGEALSRLLLLGHAVLRELPDCRVVMLTENGRLSEALVAASAAWPAEYRQRFSACASLPFTRYRDLLAASSLVVCAANGEAGERAMRECMSCETLLMAPAGAAGFLRPGVNMLERPGDSPLESVLAALGQHGRPDPAPQVRMARRNMLAQFSEATVVPRHLAEVMQAYASWKKERRRGRELG